MFKMISNGAITLVVLASFSFVPGRAAAQPPTNGYPSPPPVAGFPSPTGGGPTFNPSQPTPGGPYPQTETSPSDASPSPYPRTADADRSPSRGSAGALYARPSAPRPPAGSTYPSTAMGAQPAAFSEPHHHPSSFENHNAGVGNAGAILSASFDQPTASTLGSNPSFLDNPVQLAGHQAGGSPGCDCELQGSAKSGCTKCGTTKSLFPGSILGFHVGGWIEQGVTANFGDPDDRMNSPVLFNDRSNDYQLNQLYLFAERPVQNDGYHWDIGARIDLLLGTDAKFLTVPGLEEHQDGTPKWNGESSQYGLAIPQAYLEFAAPWLHGVSLKAGHFYSIAGYETAAAPENFFYSHSYTYLYGEPFTFTGALFTAKPNDVVTLNAGYTKGWDVLESNSNEYGILASVKFTTLDQRTSLAATVNSGQDVSGVRSGGSLIDEDRHFYSLVLQHQINDCLRYVFQHDFGYQEDAEVVVNSGPRTITFDTAKWYGINQYLIYDFNHKASGALRVEWFRDQDNSRLAVPVTFNPGGPTFLGGNYVAVTGGLNWRPNSNIRVRPEVRWDYSDLKGNGAAPGGDPNVRAFDDSRHSSQVTAAFDVIVSY